MKYFEKVSLCLFLMIGGMAISQTENTFLQQDFWKTNPTVATVDQKIKEGNDATQLNRNGFDGVTMAILANAPFKTIVHVLAKEGNGVNKLTHDGRTYIFWAAYKNNLKLVKYLLKEGAKTDIIDDHSNTIALFAAGAGNTNPKLYDLLIQNGTDLKTETNKSGANALLLAAASVDALNKLDYFISKGVPLTSKDALGNGVYNYVAKSGNIEMLKTLKEKGIAPEDLNKEGGNAMLFAAQGTRGNTNGLEVYNYLESAGVSPNVTTLEGTTPLHILAYRNKAVKTFNYFVSKGVSVNKEGINGNTALLNASGNNDLAVIKYLVENGAHINHANKKGETALLKAVAGNTPEVVAFLLQKGAKAAITDSVGNSVVFYLLNSFDAKNPTSFDKKVTLLEKNGIDLSEVQAGENNAYHLAVKNNDLSLLKELDKRNVSAAINAKNADGLTPLLIAAMNAHDATVLKYLIAKKADKKAATDFDETAYDLAMENEKLQKNNIDISFLK